VFVSVAIETTMQDYLSSVNGLPHECWSQQAGDGRGQMRFSYFMQRSFIAVQRGNATSVMGTIALMYLRLLFLPLFPYFLFVISFDEVLFHCINNVLLIFIL